MSNIDSLILPRIPEYLINEKVDSVKGKEILENITPNTINTSASIAEKILYGLEKYNNWSDFTQYSKEFKLDELFGDIGNSFALNQAELLKGFFKFKGTFADLRYILGRSGLDLDIYDSSYFLKNDFRDILRRRRFGTIYHNLLEAYPDESTFINILDSSLVKFVDNTEPYYLVNNIDYIMVVNFDSVIAAQDFFDQLGWTPNQDELDNIEVAIRSWLNSRDIDPRDYDCSIGADIIADMDSTQFNGINLRNLVTLLKSIIDNRMSVCTYLRAIEVLLYLKDTYYIDIPETTEVDITRTLIDQINRMEEYYLAEFSTSSVEQALTPKLLVDNGTPWVVNEDLIDIPGDINWMHARELQVGVRINPVDIIVPQDFIYSTESNSYTKTMTSTINRMVEYRDFYYDLKTTDSYSMDQVVEVRLLEFSTNSTDVLILDSSDSATHDFQNSWVEVVLNDTYELNDIHFEYSITDVIITDSIGSTDLIEFSPSSVEILVTDLIEVTTIDLEVLPVDTITLDSILLEDSLLEFTTTHIDSMALANSEVMGAEFELTDSDTFSKTTIDDNPFLVEKYNTTTLEWEII